MQTLDFSKSFSKDERERLPSVIVMKAGSATIAFDMDHIDEVISPNDLNGRSNQELLWRGWPLRMECLATRLGVTPSPRQFAILICQINNELVGFKADQSIMVSEAERIHTRRDIPDGTWVGQLSNGFIVPVIDPKLLVGVDESSDLTTEDSPENLNDHKEHLTA